MSASEDDVRKLLADGQQLEQIRAWVYGVDVLPDHETFHMGREFARRLVAKFDQLRDGYNALAGDEHAFGVRHVDCDECTKLADMLMSLIGRNAVHEYLENGPLE